MDKKIILTGIQPTGNPHLGNILGVISPTIKLIKKNSSLLAFILIADLHSLTNIKNTKKLKLNIYKIVATWLSLGLKIKNTIIYKQSSIPEITELTWYLNCLMPYKRLMLGHSFKNKKTNKETINTGILTYPILMAADILIYNAKIITIGKDQLQHMEITRFIAKKFNKKTGFSFKIPEYNLIKKSMNIIGIDGKKMSKSKKK